MYIIGDVHGRVNEYWKLLKRLKSSSIQLGDFGFLEEHRWFLENINVDHHRMIFGNHDYLPYVYHKHSLGDTSTLEKGRIMTIRGAYSRDKANRLHGHDWFSTEEMPYSQWQYEVIPEFESVLPSIVLSHDCPNVVMEELFGYEKIDKTITGSALSQCFELHKPDVWIFGHHHRSVNKTIDGTKFICLDELEILEI